MPRPYDFTDATQRDARMRQWGLCAHCGERLDDRWEHAHHVIPNQIGRPGDRADDFLRGADNCVIICEECHSAAHAHGSYRHGAVAPPTWYLYSHGKHAQGPHAVWCRRIETEWDRLASR